jgi:hypothetical protein
MSKGYSKTSQLSTFPHFFFIATNQSLSLQESIVLLYEVLFVILANFLLLNTQCMRKSTLPNPVEMEYG